MVNEERRDGTALRWLDAQMLGFEASRLRIAKNYLNHYLGKTSLQESDWHYKTRNASNVFIYWLWMQQNSRIGDVAFAAIALKRLRKFKLY